MNRPSKDQYFMQIAELVATRSTCLRRQVGAVIVKDGQILSTGYNGAPAGAPHCEDTGCLREQFCVPSGERHELCRGVHAEANAIIQAAKHGICIAGASLYCTHQPCSMCAKIIVNVGIVNVIYSNAYPDDRMVGIFNEAKNINFGIIVNSKRKS